MMTIFVVDEYGNKEEITFDEARAKVKAARARGGEQLHPDLKKMIDTTAKKVYSTGIKTKRENWPKFRDLIGRQFEHGGEKYALDDQPNKEGTDLVCEMSPGKTGFDWVLQTIGKYCLRYMNFQREKDLLKIATYAYIAWLKSGAHLKKEHDEDTTRSGVSMGISPTYEEIKIEGPKDVKETTHV